MIICHRISPTGNQDTACSKSSVDYTRGIHAHVFFVLLWAGRRRRRRHRTGVRSCRRRFFRRFDGFNQVNTSKRLKRRTTEGGTYVGRLVCICGREMLHEIFVFIFLFFVVQFGVLQDVPAIRSLVNFMSTWSCDTHTSQAATRQGRTSCRHHKRSVKANVRIRYLYSFAILRQNKQKNVGTKSPCPTECQRYMASALRCKSRKTDGS